MTRNYLDILAETIRENWDEPALTDFYLTEDGTAQDTSRGNRYTYGEMYAEICRVAELLTALGLQKGDHIAICGSNSANWAVAYLAIAKMQGVSVTIMHSLMPDEIANLVAFSDAKALFTDPDLWTELSSTHRPILGDSPSMHRPILGDVSVVLSLADWTLLSCDQSADNYDIYTIDTRKIHDTYTLHSDTLTEGTQEENNPRMHRPILGDSPSMPRPSMGDISFPTSAPDDLAMICFTSGSSGVAKGVMLSNRNISNNTLNAIQAFPNSNNNAFVCFLPLSHMYGFMIEFYGQIVRGKRVYFFREVLTTDNVWNCIMYIRPSGMAIIPFMITNIYNKYHDELNKYWRTFFSQIHIGGSVLNKHIIEDMRMHNIPISIGYGATETGPLISDSQSDAYRLFSSGKIVEGMQAKFSPEGEILVKGENVMLGYYKDPEATAQKIDKDGWLHTGDAGYMDEDGYLYVTGRIGQDMIVLPNGENIHPEDIENKLNALPEVQESIVVAREGHLIAIVRPTDYSQNTPNNQNTPKNIRHTILRTINPQLPLYSQLYDVEFLDQPLERTAKQTIKRYLYK